MRNQSQKNTFRDTCCHDINVACDDICSGSGRNTIKYSGNSNITGDNKKA